MLYSFLVCDSRGVEFRCVSGNDCDFFLVKNVAPRVSELNVVASRLEIELFHLASNPKIATVPVDAGLFVFCADFEFTCLWRWKVRRSEEPRRGIPAVSRANVVTDTRLNEHAWTCCYGWRQAQ